jgi:hypothetical protein
MGLIKPSNLLTDIVGSIGASTFQRGPGGLSLRRRKPPRQPGTTLQKTHQTRIAGMGALWATLSTDQRTAWSAWQHAWPSHGGLSQPIQPSGYVAWLTWALRDIHAGRTPRTTPPVGSGIHIPNKSPTMEGRYQGAGIPARYHVPFTAILLTYGSGWPTAVAGLADVICVATMSRPQMPTLRHRRGGYRVVQHTHVDTTDTDQITLYPLPWSWTIVNRRAYLTWYLMLPDGSITRPQTLDLLST